MPKIGSSGVENFAYGGPFILSGSEHESSLAERSPQDRQVLIELNKLIHLAARYYLGSVSDTVSVEDASSGRAAVFEHFYDVFSYLANTLMIHGHQSQELTSMFMEKYPQYADSHLTKEEQALLCITPNSLNTILLSLYSRWKHKTREEQGIISEGISYLKDQLLGLIGSLNTQIDLYEQAISRTDLAGLAALSKVLTVEQQATILPMSIEARVAIPTQLNEQHNVPFLMRNHIAALHAVLQAFELGRTLE